MKVVRSRPRIRPTRLALDRRIRETRSELGKISWPSREEITRLTIVVIVLSIALAVILGLIVDQTFLYLYRQLVGL
ncbi:MAG: preprotein translocase subunit SecE [Chloroflexia bacterium]